eukprot:CAMPEP_0201934620 /NCGR_PEP_ID=MMETSP0903-20130614/33997_1 /ASSEMBLY_ACC=CAM_ASM_000552 /TAXON_ID=420261 /ORGANISM="Thalassiosira antarctica, Strain CCMP982" /LENGTH=36 /DNA_ID= /DNA_START= /DNA_END= /DNA_ORIENTATION=
MELELGLELALGIKLEVGTEEEEEFVSSGTEEELLV